MRSLGPAPIGKRDIDWENFPTLRRQGQARCQSGRAQGGAPETPDSDEHNNTSDPFVEFIVATAGGGHEFLRKKSEVIMANCDPEYNEARFVFNTILRNTLMKNIIGG